MTTPDNTPNAPVEPPYDAAAIAHMQQAIPGAVASLQSVATPPSLWQQLLALVLGFLSGAGGKVKFALGIDPTINVSLTETFSALGKSWSLLIKIHDGNLILVLTAS
jgi:hypothetical protein